MGFTSIGSQFDNNNNAGAANLMPDILSKVTYDKDFSGRHFHAELTGFATGAHAAVMPVGSTAFRTHSVIGGGGQIAANYELVPAQARCPRQRLLERRWGSLPGGNRAATGDPAKPSRQRRQSFHGARWSRLCGSGVESHPKKRVRRLLRRRLFRTELLSRHYRYCESWENHRFWRTRFSQHQQPSHPAGHVRLDQYLLAESQARSAAGLHTVFLLDARPLVCRSWDAQECAFEYGLRGFPLRSADDFGNIGQGASSGLIPRAPRWAGESLLAMTIFHQAAAAVLLLILTLWLQCAGVAALIEWLKRLMARGIYKFGSIRAAALVMQTTVAMIVLHSLVILLWAGFYRLRCFSSWEVAILLFGKHLCDGGVR